MGLEGRLFGENKKQHEDFYSVFKKNVANHFHVSCKIFVPQIICLAKFNILLWLKINILDVKYYHFFKSTFDNFVSKLP